MLSINQEYGKHIKHNFGKEFQTKVTEYFTDHFKAVKADFNMPLRRSMHKGRDLKRSGDRTRSQSAFTRTSSNDTDTEQNQRLVNDKRKTVRWNRSPKVNLIESEGEILQELSTQDSSNDECSAAEIEEELADVFQFEEPPSTNNIKTKYCGLCDGAVDHETWECPKLDSVNRPEAERRKINQYRVKYQDKLNQQRTRAGMPPIKFGKTTTPPVNRPPLPREAIMPDKLAAPKVTAISEEQKEAYKNSDLTDEEQSIQDPLHGTWAFDENADNYEILENLIKDKAEVNDEEVRTPFPKFNAPFVNKNSVDVEQNAYVPIDADSEEDFDQEHYNAYGRADPSLKNC